MKEKPTPGSWFTPPEYRNCIGPWWSVNARTPETVTGIALVNTSYADACLMAAAPDLLTACEALLVEWEYIERQHGEHGGREVAMAKAAIAKAKGRRNA